MTAALPATHDEARKSVAIDYLKRIDHGGDVLALFADDALCYFPKWGIADGKDEIRQLFDDVMEIIAEIHHDHAFVNFIVSGDLLVMETSSHGTTASGRSWRAGVTHAGRGCSVMEIRGGLIQRLFIYLDPDYGDEDTARYPWLQRR